MGRKFEAANQIAALYAPGIESETAARKDPAKIGSAHSVWEMPARSNRFGQACEPQPNPRTALVSLVNLFFAAASMALAEWQNACTEEMGGSAFSLGMVLGMDRPPIESGRFAVGSGYRGQGDLKPRRDIFRKCTPFITAHFHSRRRAATVPPSGFVLKKYWRLRTFGARSSPLGKGDGQRHL